MFLNFTKDIDETIINMLCINYYADCDIFKLVNKDFCKNIKKMLDKLNNSSGNILMATHIKHWRPDSDQVSYIYDEFMISDDFNYVDEWMTKEVDYKNIKYEKNMNSINKEVIDLCIYNYYISYKYVNNVSIINNKISNKEKYKLKYENYYIYYLYGDLYTCYGIKIIILPYFDERICKKDNYLHYKKIQKNVLYNHNIKKVNSIEF